MTVFMAVGTRAEYCYNNVISLRYASQCAAGMAAGGIWVKHAPFGRGTDIGQVNDWLAQAGVVGSRRDEFGLTLPAIARSWFHDQEVQHRLVIVRLRPNRHWHRRENRW
jgi:hypothetical protein